MTCEAARINQIYLVHYLLFSDKKCEWAFFKISNIFNLYESFDILTKYKLVP